MQIPMRILTTVTNPLPVSLGQALVVLGTLKEGLPIFISRFVNIVENAIWVWSVYGRRHGRGKEDYAHCCG